MEKWLSSIADHPVKLPKPSRERRKFIDMATPNFQDGTPAFAPGDAMANMSIALDRPGTLYYVVASLVVACTVLPPRWSSSMVGVVTCLVVNWNI